jgi:hypothetical protein
MRELQTWKFRCPKCDDNPTVPKIGAKLSQQNQHLKVKTPRQINISKNILIISVPYNLVIYAGEQRQAPDGLPRGCKWVTLAR